MTWQEYNYALYPLVQSFGAYSKEEITEGFRKRRNQPLEVFKQEIRRALAECHRLDLTAYEPPRINYETPWKDELKERIETDGFLDSMLKNNGCNNLLELVNKTRAQS